VKYCIEKFREIFGTTGTWCGGLHPPEAVAKCEISVQFLMFFCRKLHTIQKILKIQLGAEFEST